ncbi:MAG: GGDEF domain-containing protein [Spirochaetaceae bacterium]|nr:MAG: GGDEF domain-containing protein [Spirochaetaceae bacterium]
MEDWYPPVSPSVRRAANAWARRNGLLIAGLREWWFDVLSTLFPSVPDRVAPRLLDALARRRHYLAENPYNYSLATTLDALYSVSRLFLGRTAGNSDEGRAIAAALKRRDPFGFEYLSRFEHYDEMLRGSFAYLELAYDQRTGVEVAALARVTREAYRLTLATELVPRQRVDKVLEAAGDALAACGRPGSAGITDASAVFRICLDNLQRFKRELYPVVLRAIGSFYEEDDTSGEKRQKILEFIDLRPSDVLTVKRFAAAEAERRERQLAEQATIEIVKVEREKAERVTERFGAVLETLAALFPDSGIEAVDQQPYLLPYFDDRVFTTSLPFDHGSANVELVSRTDPIAVILVLHRIVDDLLSAVDHYALERLTNRTGIGERLAQIKTDWNAVYTTHFQRYVRLLHELAKARADSDRRSASAANLIRSIEAEITQLRGALVHRYEPSGRARTGVVRGPELWDLVARLASVLADVNEDLNQDLGRRKDPVARKIYQELGSRAIVEYSEHTTPGTVMFKPVTRQVRRYLEARHHSSIASIPRVAQLFHVDLLRGVVNLYRYLTNDPGSVLRTAGERVTVAGDDERSQWSRERDAVAGAPDRLQIRLGEQLLSEYTDTLTGLRTKNYYLQKLPQRFSALAASGTPVSLVIVDIDHFKWINDELGHQKGDDVLRAAATTLRAAVRSGQDAAIRYGGEELLVVSPTPLAASVALAERLRDTQERQVASEELYAPVAGISSRNGEPCGTFSIGVAERADGESLEQCLERADRALYQAKRTRNAVCVTTLSTGGEQRFEPYDLFARSRGGANGSASTDTDGSASGRASARGRDDADATAQPPDAVG